MKSFIRSMWSWIFCCLVSWMHCYHNLLFSVLHMSSIFSLSKSTSVSIQQHWRILLCNTVRKVGVVFINDKYVLSHYERIEKVQNQICGQALIFLRDGYQIRCSATTEKELAKSCRHVDNSPYPLVKTKTRLPPFSFN